MIYDLESEDEIDQDKNQKTLQVPQIQQGKISPRYVAEDTIHFFPKNTILGVVNFKRWGRQRKYFFGLDIKNGRMICYNKIDSKSQATSIGLQNAEFIQKNSQDQYNLTILTRRNKKLYIVLNLDKQLDIVIKFLETCFGVKIMKKISHLKAFYATLGKGIVSFFQNPYRVTSGIFIGEEINLNQSSYLQPNKIFIQDKKHKKEMGNIFSSHKMFFGSSSVVQYILGGVALMHLYEKIDCSKNLDLKESVELNEYLIGLIFKPIAGTIDLIIMNMDNNDYIEKNLIPDFFKIGVKPKKNRKVKESNLKERNRLEETLGITDKEMFKICETDDQILYAKNNTLLLAKEDAPKICQMILNVDLDDYDSTKKQEKDYDQERELINDILDYYKQMIIQSSNYQEDNCEFMAIFPIKNQDKQNQQEEADEEYNEYMDEQYGEDLIVSDEKYVEKLENKHLPRKFVVELASQKHLSPNKIELYQTYNNLTPEENKLIKEDLIQQNIVKIERQKTIPFIRKQSTKNSVIMNDLKITLINVQEEIIQEEEILQQEEIKPIQNPQNQQEELKVEDDEDDDDEEDNGILNSKETTEYCKMNKQELSKWLANFKCLDSKGEERIPNAYKDGGIENKDKEQISTLRGVGKYVLGQVGRKIFSGDFNLTQISFPIKAMISKSALQAILFTTVLFPYYINKATTVDNPVERMKLLITATLGYFSFSNTFLKPLNPILGETFEGAYIDGTKLYSEQISHHPPICYTLVYGPDKSYKYSGYCLYEGKAGWNSLTIKNKGQRQIEFKDGQIIKFNFVKEVYSGTFMGKMKNESEGTLDYVDEKNNITCSIPLGKVKKKPSDFFSGEIKQNNKVVSKVYGSYLGFIEFDNLRYWDFRHILPFKIIIPPPILKSDGSFRSDKQYLEQKDLKKAQKAKEQLEEDQRNDAKLRKAYQEKLKQQKKIKNKK